MVEKKFLFYTNAFVVRKKNFLNLSYTNFYIFLGSVLLHDFVTNSLHGTTIDIG